MAQLFGQLSSTAWAGWKGRNKDRGFPCLWQSLLAATGSAKEKVVPLLLYWLSLRVKKVFYALLILWSDYGFFFLGNGNFRSRLRVQRQKWECIYLEWNFPNPSSWAPKNGLSAFQGKILLIRGENLEISRAPGLSHTCWPACGTWAVIISII